MNTVVRLCEHQRLAITNQPVAGTPSITRSHAERLKKLEPNLPKKAFSWSYDSIKWGSYCGLVKIGDLTLEISPKLHSDKTNVQHGREVLLKMLTESGIFQLHQNSRTQIGEHSHSLLDIFINEFCNDLTTQLRQGMARSYLQHTENLGVLRGKLLIGEHLKHNITHKNRLYCQYEELSEDTPLNRLIHTTLVAVQTVAHENRTRQRVSELRHQFDTINLISPKEAINQTIIFSRTNERFKEIAVMCKRLLNGIYPDIASGDTEGLGLLFNMNKLFESWLGAAFKKIARDTNTTYKSEGPIRHLAVDKTAAQGRNNRFRLKPDFTIADKTTNRFSPIIIADAKWKLLDETKENKQLSTADLYQMQTYAAIYGTGTIALLYPGHDNFISTHEYQFNDSPKTKLITIPISLDKSSKDIAQELITIFQLDYVENTHI